VATRWARSLTRWALALPVPLFVIMIWEYAGRNRLLAGGLVPPFSKAMATLANWIFGVGSGVPIYSGTWIIHVGASASRVLIGFAIGSILAIVLGVLVGWSPIIAQMFDPTINLIRPISVAAWITMAITLFGLGTLPAIFLISYATFFPVYMNTVHGVKYAENRLTHAALMLGASKWQLLWHVIIPGALPSILTGMRVALAVSWTTVIIAEVLAVKSGLGYVLIDANDLFRIDLVISAMISVGLLGFVTDRCLAIVQKRILYWLE
jgi:ABC-type nitrate/sulfonate/bicarbonate transport system permease component